MLVSGSVRIYNKLPRYVPSSPFAPQNGWLEYDPFPLGPSLFSGAKMLVSGRVNGTHLLGGGNEKT